MKPPSFLPQAPLVPPMADPPIQPAQPGRPVPKRKALKSKPKTKQKGKQLKGGPSRFAKVFG